MVSFRKPNQLVSIGGLDCAVEPEGRSGIFLRQHLLTDGEPAGMTKPSQPGLLKRVARALGPGLITGAADDDPSGIVTYSMAGAHRIICRVRMPRSDGGVLLE